MSEAWTLPQVPTDETLDKLMGELTVEVAKANRRTKGLVTLHFNRGKWFVVRRWNIEPGRTEGVMPILPAEKDAEAGITRENLTAAIEAVRGI